MIKIEKADIYGAIYGGTAAVVLFAWPMLWWIHLVGADHAGVFFNDGRPAGAMVFFKAILICAFFGGISGRGGSSLPKPARRRDLLKIGIHVGVVNYAWAIGLLLLAATPLTVAAVVSAISAWAAFVGLIAGHRSRSWSHR